jgi:monoterpene epsilon-lactone hydrolase
MPSKEVVALIETQRALRHSFTTASSRDESRAISRAHFVAQSAGVPNDVDVEPALIGLPAEWVRPPEADRTVLYLHGGGYISGDMFERRETVARIARSGRAVALSVNYRLAPEHPYPAALDDAFDAYCWLLEQGQVPPDKLVVLGDSAGGGLALSLLVRIRDEGIALPAAGIALSPVTDLAVTGATVETNADGDPLVGRAMLEGCRDAYLGSVNPRDPWASPLYADLTGLPPLLIQVGGAEVLVDDARRFAERARVAGVDVTLEVWPELVHIWQFYPWVREALEATDRIGAFIVERTAQTVPA